MGSKMQRNIKKLLGTNMLLMLQAIFVAFGWFSTEEMLKELLKKNGIILFFGEVSRICGML